MHVIYSSSTPRHTRTSGIKRKYILEKLADEQGDLYKNVHGNLLIKRNTLILTIEWISK